jgi:hypothetical protein
VGRVMQQKRLYTETNVEKLRNTQHFLHHFRVGIYIKHYYQHSPNLLEIYRIDLTGQTKLENEKLITNATCPAVMKINLCTLT